ncbi:MAG: restriction endonuclease subunit S [Candidatus Limivicinus sp.]|nr:restriction endonuclease subunit S [Candidatus Limivicinus sp.]
MRAMKDSGIEWIGQIPQEWVIKKLKYLVDLRTEKTADKAVPSPYVGLEHISSSVGTLIKDYEAILDFAGDTLDFKAGDVLFGKLRPYLAKAIRAETDGRCSSEFWVMNPCSVDGRFLLYAILSPGFISCINQSTFGVKMPRAEWEYAGEQALAIPDSDTQRRIANYLDEKCAEIDALIAAKEKTNALLKERRQSIIYEAITKGLNPDAPMKDSGIEWIGQIPEHWSVGKTIYGLEMPITDGPHETPQLYSDGVPFVSAEAVSCGNGKIDFDHIRGYISEEYYDECCKKYIPQINDIYMIKSGATTGKVAIVDTERKFTIWSPLAVFRCTESKFYYRYLFYFLQSDAYQKQVEAKWSFGTQQNIGMRTLERLIVCFPGINEQKSIAEYLDTCCSETEQMISKNEETIQKLKEYRQSIIYEAVTGKIEV